MQPAEAFGAITDAVAGGEISPQQGQQLAGLIESQMKAIEMSELEERLSELEKRK